jgi:predicted butyrate kinase (DUF1464 family)
MGNRNQPEFRQPPNPTWTPKVGDHVHVRKGKFACCTAKVCGVGAGVALVRSATAGGVVKKYLAIEDLRPKRSANGSLLDLGWRPGKLI